MTRDNGSQESNMKATYSASGVSATITASYQYVGEEENTLLVTKTGESELTFDVEDVDLQKELLSPKDIMLNSSRPYILFTYSFTNNAQLSSDGTNKSIKISLLDTSVQANVITKYLITSTIGGLNGDMQTKHDIMSRASSSPSLEAYVGPQGTVVYHIMIEKDGELPKYLSTSAHGLMWKLEASSERDSGDWRINSENVVTKYIGSRLDPVVPSEATAIDRELFKDNTFITSVTIPDSVKTLGEGAFENCTNLTTVTFSQGSSNVSSTRIVRNSYFAYGDEELSVSDVVLGARAFSGCTALSSVTLPDALTVLPEKVFNNCTSLHAISLPSSITNIEREAFKGSGLTELSLPDNLEMIGEESFANVQGLTTLIIPARVSNIPKDAFKSTGIVNLTLNVDTTVEQGAFENCEDLNRVTLVVEDGEFVFSGDYSEVVYPEIESGAIMSETFKDCPSLISVLLPSSIEKIQASAFENCTNLQSVEYTSQTSIKFIGNSSFKNCSSLSTFDIPSDVTYIGSSAFESCSMLNNVTFGDTANWAQDSVIYGDVARSAVDSLDDTQSAANTLVSSLVSWSKTTTVGDYVLDKDKTVISYLGTDSSLTLPTEALSIKNGMFENNTNIESVVINEKLTKIGKYTFSGCSSLKEITFDGTSKLKTISQNAFENCSTLESFAFPASVTAINADVFKNCTNLTTITLTQAQAKKAVNSFSGSALAEVRIPASEGYVGFSNLTDAKDSEIPDISYYISQGTLPTTITSIMIPSTVTYAPFDSFKDCHKLAQIINNSDSLCIDVTTRFGSSFSTVYFIYEGCNVAEPQGKFFAKDDCIIFSFGDENILVSYNGSATTLTIPSIVDSIGKYAFENNETLTEVIIPSTVTGIECYAFSGCESLERVVFQDKADWYYCTDSQYTQISSLDDESTNASYLASTHANKRFMKLVDNKYLICAGTINFYLGSDSVVVVPEGINAISHSAFSSSPILTQVTISSSIKYVESGAFSMAGFLERVIFSENSQLKNIGSDAFGFCRALQSINIPNTITRISDYTFRSCTSLASITIPSNVTRIGDYAFQSCEVLASVNIPESVTYIGSSAFYECKALGSITIPNSVSVIGEKAFSGCSALTSVNFENNALIQLINKYTFQNCTSLTSITIPSSVSTIRESAFSGCSSLSEVVFEEGSELFTLEKYAFSACYKLATITLPSRLYSFNHQAFNACYNLVQIISKSRNVNLTKGNGAAQYANEVCNANDEPQGIFTTVNDCKIFTYGEDVALVGYDGSASSLVIPKEVTAIGAYVFSENSLLKNVTIEENNNLKTIGQCAFDSCSALESIDFNNSTSLKAINDYAFRGCFSLNSIIIPINVDSIANSSFSACVNLVQVINKSTHRTITKGYQDNGYIGFYAIEVCNINDEPEGIFTTVNDCKIFTYGAEAVLLSYKGDENSVVIPKEVTKLGLYAFKDQTQLESVVFEDGSNLTEISSSAFSGCSSLSSISLPSSIKQISNSAFYGCTSLSSVIFESGSELESVGASAFRDCLALSNITLPSTVETIGSRAFEGCSSLATFVIPSGVTSIGSHAFEWCTSLTSITIPSAVTFIDYQAFNYCSSLTSVTFEEATGWHHSGSSNFIPSSSNSLDSSVLSDPISAAQYLTTTNSNQILKRVNN